MLAAGDDTKTPGPAPPPIPDILAYYERCCLQCYPEQLEKGRETSAQPVCGGDCHKDEKQNWRKRGPQEEVRRWHFNLAVPPDGSLSTESTRRQEPFNWINKTRTFQLDQQDDKNHLTGSTSQEPCNCFLCNHLHSSLYISTDWTIS
ncbi:uncharacterized protein LOC113211485 [Frankliniella occidentalis]|uniref:Uncharacterized protein LOC113211485 n=1 Tax=Frankliniella occidentalis TaxID=133901 RepID=A0A6J1SXQ7_FRAOC|nr:uncharacterized protein LOC113211485 [Frankliniella occidentalis]XP_026285648.1 uncharacterized protein LOC113211485 [Frankliniella occidentalis]